MRVLVTGANGFIGAHVAEALRAAGHETVSAVRRPAAEELAHESAIACDFAVDADPAIWEPRLAGVDAVVNCAGILRETRADRFQSIHVDAPLALFRACAAKGVRRVIQLSALGEPVDGEFIASKHRCDAALSGLDLDWLVLRPGLVYSTDDAHGGTALLRAMAALPGWLVVPGDGAHLLRPVAIDDLACAIVNGLHARTGTGEVIEIVGPEVLTLRDYLLAWRKWFGLEAGWVSAAPAFLVRAAAALGELLGRGPLCRVIVNLLQRRRIGAAQAPARTEAMLGRRPMALAEALRRRPCRAQDLLHARWYLLRWALILTLALVWIGSGLVGCLLLSDDPAQLLPGWPPATVRVATLATSIADLGLGLALLTGRGTRPILILMLLMVCGYTLSIGSLAPQHWLDPFGGLLKNLPIAAALGVLLAMDGRRRP